MARCVREPYGKGHQYFIDGKWAPGVTTVLGATADKPGLRYWYAYQAVLWAMEQDPAYLRGLHWKELKALAGKAPDLMRDAAAEAGKTVHEYAEALGMGQAVEPKEELADQASLVADFQDHFKMKPLANEATVWHEHLGYAGTFDLIADLWIDGERQRWLLDYKTGKGIYREAVLQCSAYRYATHIVWQGKDLPMPEVQHTGVVHVTPNGWALHPIKADQEAFGAFTAAMGLYPFLTTKQSELVAPALAQSEQREGRA